jgi:hypothetical protein
MPEHHLQLIIDEPGKGSFAVVADQLAEFGFGRRQL